MNPQKEANCCVLGDGSEASHHDHVSRVTPFQTKKKEIQDDPMYKSQIDKGIDQRREAATTKARREDARPLDGGAAK